MRRNRRRRRGVWQTLARVVRVTVVTGALGAAAFGGITVAAWAVEHPYFGVRHVQVSGARALEARELLAWTGISPGESLWTVDEVDATARLLRHPRVRAASVATEFPNRILLAIEEREAIARLLGTSGRREALLVDQDARLFSPFAGERPGDLPCISGIRSADLVARSPGVASRLERAVHVLRTWQRHPEWPPVSEIRAEENGEVVVLPEERPMVIRFGAEIAEDQFARLSAVFRLWKGRELEVAGVDVSVPGQAVLKLRSRAGDQRTDARQTRLLGI